MRVERLVRLLQMRRWAIAESFVGHDAKCRGESLYSLNAGMRERGEASLFTKCRWRGGRICAPSHTKELDTSQILKFGSLIMLC